MATSPPHVASWCARYGVYSWWLSLFLVLWLPVQTGSASLRGLLERPRALVQPLQRPPPATADSVFAQMSMLDGVPAPVPAPAPGPLGSPGPAPGPYPGQIIMPSAPKLPPITAATCVTLTGKIGAVIGAAAGGPGPAPGPSPGPGPGPGPAPGNAPAAAALLDMTEDSFVSAPAPGPGGPPPTVHCELYAFETGKAAGCQCFLEAPPPPFVPKVSGCPNLPDALSMGFTGAVVEMPSMQFGPRTGGWLRQTCFYRQWFFNPTATGIVRAYQENLADARAGKFLVDTYAAAMRNAKKSVEPMWALTPVPWLKLYPTTPMPMPGLAAAAPSPGPAGGFGVGMLTTTGPIIYSPEWYQLHTPMPMMTTPMMGLFGAGGFTAAPGFTTAPTFAIAR